MEGDARDDAELTAARMTSSISPRPGTAEAPRPVARRLATAVFLLVVAAALAAAIGPRALGAQHEGEGRGAAAAEAHAGEESGGAGHGDPLSHVAHNPIYVPLTVSGVDLHITKAVVMMWIAAVVLVLLLGLVGAAARGGSLVPRGFRNCIESVVVFLRDGVVHPALGPHNGDKFLPLFLTFFFFILALNLSGMFPGASTATSKVSVTAALASITLATMLIGGMKEQGVVAFWKNLVPHGIPWWLWPLMFVIEIVGLVAKPFALTIRLFANMTAGHIVLAVLIGFTVVAKSFLLGALIVPASIFGAVAISLLEIFVAFLQAYIFTFLSAVFVGMCLHPEH